MGASAKTASMVDRFLVREQTWRITTCNFDVQVKSNDCLNVQHGDGNCWKIVVDIVAQQGGVTLSRFKSSLCIYDT